MCLSIKLRDNYTLIGSGKTIFGLKDMHYLDGEFYPLFYNNQSPFTRVKRYYSAPVTEQDVEINASCFSTKNGRHGSAIFYGEFKLGIHVSMFKLDKAKSGVTWSGCEVYRTLADSLDELIKYYDFIAEMKRYGGNGRKTFVSQLVRFKAEDVMLAGNGELVVKKFGIASKKLVQKYRDLFLARYAECLEDPGKIN